MNGKLQSEPIAGQGPPFDGDFGDGGHGGGHDDGGSGSAGGSGGSGGDDGGFRGRRVYRCSFCGKTSEKLDRWLRGQMKSMFVQTVQTCVKTSLSKSEDELVHRSRCLHRFSPPARLMNI